jgi:TonB-linked SusC/RagA family outer membrane protein
MEKTNLSKLRFRGLKYLVMLWMFCCGFSAFAQTNIRGKVKDTEGNPLVGLSVVVKGTTIGTVTDNNGLFSLKVSATNPVLTFSFLGYKKQTITVGANKELTVVMEEDNELLNEVMVVGYGIQKKSTLTGSVSQIKGDELLKTPSTNISSLLGGRVAGIQSVQSSGQPGADQAALTIRGSIYGVTYIVDGMPRSINDIDPNDIESISVLKDGAAAAVYGLKGAGGVIIVTTKKGHVGKSQITYNGTYGISQNANFPKFLDGPSYALYYNKALEMDGSSPVFTKSQIAKMTNGDDTDGWGNTDWLDQIFGVGHNQQHSVTVQGGTEDIKYFVSMGYMDQVGNIKNYTYERYNVRANIDANIAKNWKFSIGLAGQLANSQRPGYEAGTSGADGDPWMTIVYQAVNSRPYLPVTYNGMYVATPNASNQPNSPVAALNNSGKFNNYSHDIQSNFSLQYDVPGVKGLNLKATGSYDFSTSRSKNLSTPYYVNMARIPDTSTSDITFDKVIDARGNTYYSLGEGVSEYTQLVGQASVNYATTIGEQHHVDAMALSEVRDYKTNSFAAYGKSTNPIFESLPELGLAQPDNNPIAGASNQSRSLGYVFRLKYDYADKYLAEFTGRYDGSYKFSGNVSGKRWGFFPSLSVGWRVSGEDFMDGLSYVDNFKIRGSVGMLGNDGVPAYAYLNTYDFRDNSTTIGGELVNSVYTTGYANPNLTWERTLSYNGGFDLNMWKGLLGVEFDAFYSFTYDILTAMGSNYAPSMGGYYPTYENYERMDIKGIEVTLTHKSSFGTGKNKFNFGAGLNLTYAKSRWLRYPDSPNTPDYAKITGKPVGTLYGWVADGLFQSEEEIDNSPWPFGERPRPGDIKYEDLNGDGIVDYQDKAFVGKSNRPELTAGLNLSGDWRGFDFSLQFTGAAVCEVSLTGTYYNGYDDNTIYTKAFNGGANSPVYLVENAWRPDNTDGTYPRLTINDPHNNNGLASTFWFRDAKYIRLKSAQIGYSLPASLTRKVGIARTRIFVQGSNLFTLSGLPEGIDPESPRVNNGYYPQQKTFMTGITLTF